MDSDSNRPIYDRRRRAAASGRVGFDSVGNAYRYDSEHSDALNLHNPELALAPDQGATADPVENRSGASAGYNPYGSGLLVRHEQPGRRRDLRALSNWIDSKRRAAEGDD